MKFQTTLTALKKQFFSWEAWPFWLCLGLLVRFLPMPFTGHYDLYSSYTKSWYYAFEGQLFPGKFAYLWLAIQSVFLRIMAWIWPAIEGMFISNPQTMAADMMEVLSQDKIFRLTFFLKIPFLILEMIALKIFLTLFSNKQQKLSALILWLFNPIVIFSLYVFGRNDSFSMLIIVLMLVAIVRKNWLQIALTTGLLIAVRLFGLIFLPIYLLASKQSLTKKIQFICITTIPILISILVLRLFGDDSIQALEKAPLYIDFFFPANIGIGHGMLVYLIPGFFLLFFLGLWWKGSIDHSKIIPWMGFTLFALFAMSFYHPYYFTWLAPFSIWLYLHIEAKYRNKLLAVFLLQIFGWGLTLLFWGMSVSFGLLSPINPYFFHSIGSVGNLIQPFFPFGNLVNVGRTIVFSTHVFICWLWYHYIIENKSTVKKKI